MTERRSLGEALSLSTEKLAFIKGQESSTEEPSEKSRKPRTKTIDLSSVEETLDPEQEPRIRRPRSRQESEPTIPNASEVLNEVLVPLTTRLPHRLVQSLRRLCLEQRLQHAKPDSIQEIIETCIEDWLAKKRR